MRKIIRFLGILTYALTFAACGGKQSSVQPAGGDTIRFRYAANLQAVKYPAYTVVTLRNPWDTLKTLHTYILVKKAQPRHDSLPDGTIIQIPLAKALVYSSVHCSLFDELDALGNIGGVCDLQYIYLPHIQEAYRAGRITDCGNSMNPDIEKVINLHPDGILLSPFENSGGYGRIEKLNIPIIECADYMETSPLGRAEWMRFFGMLTGKEAQADSLFDTVEKAYLQLKEQVKATADRPSVVSELKSGAAWYVPTGSSTMGRLYADAGAHYLFSYIKGSGSVPLSFETVLDKAQHADYWILKYNRSTDMTLSGLQKEYAPYARFDAFGKQLVYGCNTRHIPFYEESPFHPDRLLKDFIKIFHPQLLPGYELQYFSKLAK